MAHSESSSSEPSHAPHIYRKSAIRIVHTILIISSLSIFLVSTAWFCFLQPPRDKSAGISTVSLAEWIWYPVVKNAYLKEEGEALKNYDIFFSGPSEGWIAADHGGLLHTSTAGKSWSPQSSGVDQDLYSLHFVDEKTGWAVGDGGVIIHTSNGGSGWEIQRLSNKPTPDLNSVYFTDAKTGWAAGDEGELLSTTDGGSSWRPAKTGIEGYVHGLFFTGPENGYAASDMGIFRTLEPNSSWEKTTPHEPGESYLSIYFVDAANGWAVGKNGLADCSADGGKSWKPGQSNISEDLHSVQFITRFIGWAVGNGGSIVSTLDGGQSWSEEKSDTKEDLRSVWFSDRLTGWVVGHNDTLLNTTDGGTTWVNALEYSYYPAPVYYVLLAISLALLLPVIFPFRSESDDSIANSYLSDSAASSEKLKNSDIATIANALANYLRNSNTGKPLVISVIGAWGSGKTTLMNLVRKNLNERRFQTVWFNAWHHEQEQHLLAALVESIRSQAIPPFWHFEGIVFRCSLFFERYRRRWIMVLAAAALTMLVTTWLLKIDLPVFDQLTAQSPDMFAERFLKLLPLGALLAPFFLLYRLMTAFGVEPARFVQGMKGGGGIANARELTSFRFRFAEEFGEVTRALQPYTMVIFIDDLDRCSPDHMMMVLETISFLTSSGDCIIILGMEESVVHDCLMRRLEWRFPQETNSQTPQFSQEQKSDFAWLWLEKLVQVRVAVPRLSTFEAQRMVTGESFREPLTTRKKRSVVSEFVRNSALTIRPWFPFGIRMGLLITSVLFGYIVAGSLPKAPPKKLEVWLSSLFQPEPTNASSKNEEEKWIEWLSMAVLTTTMSENKSELRLSMDDGQAPPEPINPDPPITPPVEDLSESSGPPMVRPAQSPISIGRLGIPLLAAVSIATALSICAAVRRQNLVLVQDSPSFLVSVKEWWPEIAEGCKTPRAIKRFINRVRFHAMMMKSPTGSNLSTSIPDDEIVAFEVLALRNSKWLQERIRRVHEEKLELEAPLQERAETCVRNLCRMNDIDYIRRLLETTGFK